MLWRTAVAAARSFFAGAIDLLKLAAPERSLAAGNGFKKFPERAAPERSLAVGEVSREGLGERESAPRMRCGAIRIWCGACNPGCAGRLSNSLTQSNFDWTVSSVASSSSCPGWSKSRRGRPQQRVRRVAETSARRISVGFRPAAVLTRLTRGVANLSVPFGGWRDSCPSEARSWSCALSWSGSSTSGGGNRVVFGDSGSNGGTIRPDGEPGCCHTSLSTLGCGLRSPSAASSCRTFSPAIAAQA
jgi:hypothetical protein